MDSDFHHAGIESFITLLDHHGGSFAYVFKKSSLDYIKYLVDGFRDFDLLSESLGNF